MEIPIEQQLEHDMEPKTLNPKPLRLLECLGPKGLGFSLLLLEKGTEGCLLLAIKAPEEKSRDPKSFWVAVKELKLSYHNGYIYIYSK